MATLVDGLGNEELGDAGDPAQKTAQLFITGSVTAGAQISGLNLFAAGSIVADKIIGDVQISGLDINATGSITGDKIVGDVQVSGLDLFAQGSGTFGRHTNADGALFPVTIGSPGAFGAIVQAGSAGTVAGSTGFIALRQAYANTEYAVILTPFSGGSIAAFTSGVQNAASGTNFVGGPSNRYHWMAVGL